jgi:hypothetical protein
MIQRLFVLLLLSIIVIGGSASFRPTQSANPAPCAQNHEAWLKQVSEKMEAIKPGMTRWDLLKVLRTEGTPRPRLRTMGEKTVKKRRARGSMCGVKPREIAKPSNIGKETPTPNAVAVTVILERPSSRQMPRSPVRRMSHTARQQRMTPAILSTLSAK